MKENVLQPSDRFLSLKRIVFSLWFHGIASNTSDSASAGYNKSSLTGIFCSLDYTEQFGVFLVDHSDDYENNIWKDPHKLPRVSCIQMGTTLYKSFPHYLGAIVQQIFPKFVKTSCFVLQQATPGNTNFWRSCVCTRQHFCQSGKGTQGYSGLDYWPGTW